MPTPDSYWRIKSLFVEALEKAPEERGDFLAAACAGDVKLLQEVQALLASHDRAAGLVRPSAGAAPRQAQFAVESPGTVIGSYTTRELIGEGGMGVVYKAEQHAPIHRFVALKLIKLGMDTKQVIARFESERQALALMNHPNVAAVYDAGATDTGRPYFVMEYVDGTPITSFCDRQKYTARQRLELFVQACDAIQHAHQKAIIHRDVKPGNILVTLAGDKPTVKVIDFGVAKATAQRLTEQTIFTETGQLVGTPEYMSPEQAELHPLDVDTRTDIYSLGVVLYQLLAGALPFDSKSLRQAAYAQIQAIVREVDPPRPSTRLSSMTGEAAAEVAAQRSTQATALERELRGELEWIPMKAMRKDRARRYHTANDLAQDIRNYLEQKPLMAAPESRTYRFRKFLSRNKGPAIASALVFVVLVAGIIGTTIAMIGESRQRVIAERERAAAQKQYEETERIASLATAVSAFQGSMLSGIDVVGVPADKITVLQVVEQAVKELDAGKLKDQPLAESNVREMIAGTYFRLGRLQDAERLYRKSLDLRRSALQAPHWGIARSIQSLARTLNQLGQHQEAESLMREALAMRQAVLTAGHEDIAESLSSLGLMLEGQGKYAEAETVCREAVEIHRRNLPAGLLDLAEGLGRLGWVLQVEGKLDESEAICREALDIRRRNLPAGNVDIAESLNHLGVVFARKGRFDEAEPLFREMLEIDRKVLAPGHPRISQTINNLATVLQEQDKFAEAEALHRESLALRRSLLPAGHPNIAQSLANIANLLRKQGNTADAEPLARESLEIRRAAFKSGNPEIAKSLQILAEILAAQGKPAEAEPLYREALASLESAFGKDDFRVGSILIKLGLALTELDRHAEAENALLEAHRVLSSDKNVPVDNRVECFEAIIALHKRWEQSDPGNDHQAQADEWSRKRAALLASTRPSTKP